MNPAPGPERLSRFPSIRLVRPVFATLMQQGVDPIEVLEAAKIQPASVASGRERISPRTLGRLFSLAAERTSADFGLLAAQVVDYRFFASLGGSSDYLLVELVLTREDVMDALVQLERYSRIGWGAGGYRATMKGGGVEVRCELEPGGPTPRPVADYLMSWIYLALKQRAGNPLDSAKFWFQHARPKHLELYEKLLGKQLTFNADSNRFWLSAADVARPLAAYQLRVAAELASRAEAELRALSGPADFAEEVRAVLESDLGSSWFNGNVVAGKLGISFRTLSRRLAGGPTYQKLVDERRARLADQYLGVERLSVARCAEKLGFSGPSAFHRAFKRWHGVAPADHRRG